MLWNIKFYFKKYLKDTVLKQGTKKIFQWLRVLTGLSVDQAQFPAPT